MQSVADEPGGVARQREAVNTQQETPSLPPINNQHGGASMVDLVTHHFPQKSRRSDKTQSISMSSYDGFDNTQPKCHIILHYNQNETQVYVKWQKKNLPGLFNSQ